MSVVQINLPDTVSVNVMKTAFDLGDLASFPEVSLAAMLIAGFRETLNNAANSGGAEASFEDKWADAEAKAQALRDGIVRVTNGREADPVRREMRKIATDQVTAALRKAGKKVKDIDNFAEIVNAHLAKNESKIRPVAEANVATVRDLEIDVDLG